MSHSFHLPKLPALAMQENVNKCLTRESIKVKNMAVIKWCNHDIGIYVWRIQRGKSFLQLSENVRTIKAMISITWTFVFIIALPNFANGFLTRFFDQNTWVTINELYTQPGIYGIATVIIVEMLNNSERLRFRLSFQFKNILQSYSKISNLPGD